MAEYRLGIKQPDTRDVTGTVVMMDSSAQESNIDTLSMKKSQSGVILYPQPHDDPNDPLNWPIWRRDLCLFVVGFQTFIGGGQTPLLAAGLSELSKDFHKPATTISYLVGGYMLALGVGSVFASPTAVLYGKRLTYLLGILIFMVGSIWAAAAPNFGNLMGGRIITGIGTSPTESLPSATISEIYFAHERAYRIGIYTMLMLGGKNIVPLLSGLVFQYLNRHWLFWILTIFLGANLLLTFLFVPETFWDRSPIPNKRSIAETEAAQNVRSYRNPQDRPNAFALRMSSAEILEVNSSIELESCSDSSKIAETPVGISAPEGTESHHETFKKKTYVNTLSLFSGRHTEDSWWMVALRPFLLYLYPSVLLGSLLYSLAIIWLIVISEVISEIFSSNEYKFNRQTIGLFYISPFIGGILGSMSTGLISDRITRYFIKLNDGVYEPEFRLVMMIPATILTVLGLMGFGWSTYVEDAWIGPVIFFGCISFGSSMSSTTAITYTVDSYKMFASESLVCLNLMKNTLGFIFSLFNNASYNARGGRTIFIIYGSVQIFVSLFCVPVYVYGKVCRRWTDEKEILKFLYKQKSPFPK